MPTASAASIQVRCEKPTSSTSKSSADPARTVAEATSTDERVAPVAACQTESASLADGDELDGVDCAEPFAGDRIDHLSTMQLHPRSEEAPAALPPRCVRR